MAQKPDRRPGEYPSGGAVSTTWQVWKVIASQLDFIAPDIYEEEIKPIIAEYGNDQPLLIPETRIDKDIFRIYFMLLVKEQSAIHLLVSKIF